MTKIRMMGHDNDHNNDNINYYDNENDKNKDDQHNDSILRSYQYQHDIVNKGIIAV